MMHGKQFEIPVWNSGGGLDRLEIISKQKFDAYQCASLIAQLVKNLPAMQETLV